MLLAAWFLEMNTQYRRVHLPGHPCSRGVEVHTLSCMKTVLRHGVHIFTWEQWSHYKAQDTPSHGVENCPEGLLLQPFCGPGDGLRKARAVASGCSCCGPGWGLSVLAHFSFPENLPSSSTPPNLRPSALTPFLLMGYFIENVNNSKIVFFISLLKNRGHSCTKAEVKVAKSVK